LDIAEVYEGIYRKSRVAIKVLKESNSAALFLHEADIMRYILLLFIMSINVYLVP
jgi:hypothetical protein